MSGVTVIVRLRAAAVLTSLLGCASSQAPAPAPPPPPPAAAAPSAAPAATASSAPPAPTGAAGASTAPSGPTNTAPVTPAAPTEGAARFDDENVYQVERVATLAVVPLLDASGKPLPQTDDRPTTTSQSFTARMQLLARAIRLNDPSSALPAFFPQVAYAQVKDIPEPERDWERRLVGAFKRDIAEYHKKLGAGGERAVLEEISVAEGSAKYMKPGSEGNRVGYFRALRSKLVFRLASGRKQALELTSLISWRGEWFVVHLHGFK